MNFQRFTRFCSMFYLIAQYRVLGENDVEKSKETPNNMHGLDSNVPDDDELKYYQSKLEEVQLKTRLLEREKRRKNILIYKADFGMVNPDQLEERIRHFMHDVLRVELKSSEIDFINIINKGPRKRAIYLIGLTTWRKKNDIMRNANRLNGRVIITDDYPPAVLAIRRELLPEMHRLRAEGRFATVKYDELITRKDN